MQPAALAAPLVPARSWADGFLVCNISAPRARLPASALAPACSRPPAVCYNITWLLGADERLRGAALLALTKLMVVDSSFCEHKPAGREGHSNLDLLFTLVQRECVGCGVARLGALPTLPLRRVLCRMGRAWLHSQWGGWLQFCSALPHFPHSSPLHPAACRAAGPWRPACAPT